MEKLASEVGIRTNILDWVHREMDWPDICGLGVAAKIEKCLYCTVVQI